VIATNPATARLAAPSVVDQRKMIDSLFERYHQSCFTFHRREILERGDDLETEISIINSSKTRAGQDGRNFQRTEIARCFCSSCVMSSALLFRLRVLQRADGLASGARSPLE
jgi:hypothetical protein